MQQNNDVLTGFSPVGVITMESKLSVATPKIMSVFNQSENVCQEMHMFIKWLQGCKCVTGSIPANELQPDSIVSTHLWGLMKDGILINRTLQEIVDCIEGQANYCDTAEEYREKFLDIIWDLGAKYQAKIEKKTEPTAYDKARNTAKELGIPEDKRIPRRTTT